VAPKRGILTVDPAGLLPAAVRTRLTGEGFRVVPVGRNPAPLTPRQMKGVVAVLACDRAADREVRRLVASALALEPHLPVLLCCPAGQVDPHFASDPRHRPVGLPLPPDADAILGALRQALAEAPGGSRPPRALPTAGPLIPLEVFHEVGKALTSTLQLSEVLNVIAETTSRFVQCEAWSLLLLDERRQELRFEIATGPQGPQVKQFRLKPGEGLAGWVARAGQACLVENAAADPRFAPHVDGATGFATRTVLCVPLTSKGKVLGVIELLNKQGGAFDDRDLTVVSILADYAAIAIENARLYQRAEELAVTDDVTGIHNSRYFHQLLERELERARRYARPLSVLFIDLDQFKAVNDTHGHQRGSRVLREVAQLLKASIRSVDLIARYGGDEFIVVLPDTDAATAAALGERLRATVARTEFLAPEGLRLRLTASFGVAAHPDDAQTKEELVRSADQAMYQAKARGGNAVWPGKVPAGGRRASRRAR
jgi:diguanylate cyclase (GGDEF)-like protein